MQTALCTACVASAVASALPPALGGLEGLRPLPSAFYHVLPPPSTEKIETTRPWVVSLSWRMFPVLRIFPALLAPRHHDFRQCCATCVHTAWQKGHRHQCSLAALTRGKSASPAGAPASQALIPPLRSGRLRLGQ